MCLLINRSSLTRKLYLIAFIYKTEVVDLIEIYLTQYVERITSKMKGKLCLIVLLLILFLTFSPYVVLPQSYKSSKYY